VRPIDLIEKELYRVAFECSCGNITLMSEVLGRCRQLVSLRVKEYGFKPFDRPAPVPKPTEKLKNSRFLTNSFEAYKTQNLLAALEKNGYNRSRAAEELGVSLRMVRYTISNLKSLGYDIPDNLNFRRRPK